MRAGSEALLLGLLHGPVELVPVSSSAHVAAVPWMLDWEVAGWTGAARKELEVSLHAGTGAALVVLAVSTARRGSGAPARRSLRWWTAALGPAALAGLAFEAPIEERLRGPLPLAAGLLAGGAALFVGDRAPAVRDPAAADCSDALWLGVAQACALVPGISRSGATLAAARARRFDRPAASRLSWEVGLPVLLGAGALKGRRVLTSGDRGRRGAALAAGAAGAFVSTLATGRAIGLERRAPLWRWAAWRVGLAASIVLVRENRARD
jgi:undecaprenyl-diphosphatase